MFISICICIHHRAAICLCGTSACRGSFLYFAGNKAFMEVLNDRHNMLHRQAMLLRAASEPLNDGDRQRLKVSLISNEGVTKSV